MGQFEDSVMYPVRERMGQFEDFVMYPVREREWGNLRILSCILCEREREWGNLRILSCIP